MTFTFNSDQIMAGVILIFIFGAVFGTLWERRESGKDGEIEMLEDEIEVLQQEILCAEKDKDHLRELLWDLSQHPAIPHLLKDKNKARRMKAVK